MAKKSSLPSRWQMNTFFNDNTMLHKYNKFTMTDLLDFQDNPRIRNGSISQLYKQKDAKKSICERKK